ncbi:GTP-binding protein [Paraburkholderia sp. CNPSo 3272]|uniref:GTP-binding protein n=1 Tax=Paraburkholderia sp. CNPSo 3272 TaxID=2940931 RepID=UPI0035CD2158
MGPSMLRIKGIVNVQGEDRPVLIHGVQHVFHPPVRLDAWPGEDRRSRVVFITRAVERETSTPLPVMSTTNASSSCYRLPFARVRCTRIRASTSAASNGLSTSSTPQISSALRRSSRSPATTTE